MNLNLDFTPASLRHLRGEERSVARGFVQEGTSVQFRETLRGYFAFGESDPASGYREGRQGDSTLRARLSVVIDDLERFLRDPSHSAALSGTIDCPELGGSLAIASGTLSLFPDDTPGAPKRMCYRILFRDGAGQPLTLVGTKVLAGAPGPAVWRETTTLALRLVAGHEAACADDPDALVAAGLLRISTWGVARMLLSLSSLPGSLGPQAGVARFVGFFARQLWASYFGAARRRRGLERAAPALSPALRTRR